MWLTPQSTFALLTRTGSLAQNFSLYRVGIKALRKKRFWDIKENPLEGWARLVPFWEDYSFSKKISQHSKLQPNILKCFSGSRGISDHLITLKFKGLYHKHSQKKICKTRFYKNTKRIIHNMERVQGVPIDRINGCLISFYKTIIPSLTLQWNGCVELTAEFVI